MSLATRLQRWTRDLSWRRVERYGPILSPHKQALLERDPSTLGIDGIIGLLGMALRVRPVLFLRTGPLREWMARLKDEDTPARRVAIRELKADLEARLGDGARVSDDLSLRRQYSRDLGEAPPALAKLLFRTIPHLVVQPAVAEHILEVHAFARENKLPIYPRGVASWGFGGVVPTQNGIVIDMSPMDAIDAPDVRRRTVVVEGGAKWGHIADRVEPLGLALKCYPSSRFSTVAGWISTGGYGLTAFGHGHVRNSVGWVEIAAPSGRIVRVTEDDENFDLIFSSEGQLGLITRVQLKLIARPAASFPHLIYASCRRDLFAFVRALDEAELEVSMVKYFDRDLMACFNEVYRVHAHEPAGSLVEETDAVLVQVDGRDHEESFRRFLATHSQDDNGSRLREAPLHVSRYLWHDRFNPLKIQLLGPSLLAGELVIDSGRAGPYIDAVKRIGRQFKLDVLIESHFLRDVDGGAEAGGGNGGGNGNAAGSGNGRGHGHGDVDLLLIPMFHSDRRRRFMYLNHVSLVPMLTRLGVRMGGRPYGIGIWNTPFLRDRHTVAHLGRLARWKNELDPDWAVNPHKFWRIRSRFFGIPGWAFAPRLFAKAMDLLLVTARRRGALVPRRPAVQPATGRATPFLAEVALRCTNCGNCVAVCPAYQVTKDERTTARLKLRVGERLVAGQQVDRREADQAWICTRCGECERVCQTELPLLAAYDQLEEGLAPRFGRPEEKIRAFVEGLGENPDYLELIDSEPFRSA